MKLNFYLILIIGILYILGTYTFYSVSLIYSQKTFGDPYYYFKRFFLGNIFIPILFFLIFSLFKWSALKKIAFFLFIINFIFFILAFLPYFKLPGQDTARWFHFYGFSFQPSEFMKFSSILFFSFLIPLIKKERDYFFVSLGIIMLISFLILKQPSYSILLIFLAGIVGGFLSINFSFKNILIFLMIFFLITLLAFTQGHRIERLIGILSGDVKGYAFQLKQAQIAIGSGGLFGKGLGNSELKLIGIPLIITDSIFAIYAEELGFVGALILIILFLILINKIFYIGAKIYDEEKKFFAYAVGCWISAQAFIHIISNMIFTTGVPLPFFSYGPSSQIAVMSALGIINSLKNS